jgi:hypothetical protein
MVASSPSPTLVSPVRAHDQERPRRRRSGLERLLDRTILEPTHPELGTCWRFTGTTTPYGRIAKAQDSYTHRLGWNSSAARSLTAWSCITAAASPPAGIRTTWSSLPMRKTWPLRSRRIASMGICCRVPISGSTRARVRGSAGRAARKVSERSGSAKPQPSSFDTHPDAIRSLVRFRASPISAVMLTCLAQLPPAVRAGWGAVLSHAIWSTSHLNWTNPRACLTQSGPRGAAARANAGDVGATCPVGVSWPTLRKGLDPPSPDRGDEPAEAGIGRRIARILW